MRGSPVLCINCRHYRKEGNTGLSRLPIKSRDVCVRPEVAVAFDMVHGEVVQYLHSCRPCLNNRNTCTPQHCGPDGRFFRPRRRFFGFPISFTIGHTPHCTGASYANAIEYGVIENTDRGARHWLHLWNTTISWEAR